MNKPITTSFRFKQLNYNQDLEDWLSFRRIPDQVGQRMDSKQSIKR
jgi:hypothetical protein